MFLLESVKILIEQNGRVVIVDIRFLLRNIYELLNLFIQIIVEEQVISKTIKDKFDVMKNVTISEFIQSIEFEGAQKILS